MDIHVGEKDVHIRQGFETLCGLNTCPNNQSFLTITLEDTYMYCTFCSCIEAIAIGFVHKLLQRTHENKEATNEDPLSILKNVHTNTWFSFVLKNRIFLEFIVKRDFHRVTATQSSVCYFVEKRDVHRATATQSSVG